MTSAPFMIGTMATALAGDAARLRPEFARDHRLIFDAPLAPDMLEMLLARAAAANFVDDDVEYIGRRDIEAPQRVGSLISLILARQPFRQWIEQATGQSPLRAVAGRLVQTSPGAGQSLEWHNDMDGANRLLGVVINLSDRQFSGGQFEMRYSGTEQPFLSHRYERPGSMMLFAVRPDLEHRVAEVMSGGPRRVYAGWFLSEPEHGKGILSTRP